MRLSKSKKQHLLVSLAALLLNPITLEVTNDARALRQKVHAKRKQLLLSDELPPLIKRYNRTANDNTNELFPGYSTETNTYAVMKKPSDVANCSFEFEEVINIDHLRVIPAFLAKPDVPHAYHQQRNTLRAFDFDLDDQKTMFSLLQRLRSLNESPEDTDEVIKDTACKMLNFSMGFNAALVTMNFSFPNGFANQLQYEICQSDENTENHQINQLVNNDAHSWVYDPDQTLVPEIQAFVDNLPARYTKAYTTLINVARILCQVHTLKAVEEKLPELSAFVPDEWREQAAQQEKEKERRRKEKLVQQQLEAIENDESLTSETSKTLKRRIMSERLKGNL